MMDLSGKHILVTGASRGLGAAVALAAARAGAHVIVLGRTQGALEALDDTLQAEGRNPATLIPFDLTKLDELEILGPQLAARFSHIDGWVSCAMQLGTLGPVAHAKLSDYRKLLDLAVLSNVQMIRTLDPLLRAAPDPRVVFILDRMNDGRGPAYWGPYATAKAAQMCVMQTYAAEQGVTQLKVNGFDPGPMRTQIRTGAFPGEDVATLPDAHLAAEKVLDLLSPTCVAQGQVLHF